MEGELGTGARIAIAVILICVIIGIVFGIISFVKGKADEGTATMEGTMSAMSESDWGQFDQQTKTGSQVMSTIQLNEGKEVTFVVTTLRGSTLVYGTGVSATPAWDATVPFIGGNGGGSTVSLDLAATAGTGDYKGNDYGLARNSSDDAYVRGTGKFDAKLIKDAGNQIIGVYFNQVK